MKKIFTLVFTVYAGLSNAQTWCPPGAEWVYDFTRFMAEGYEKFIYEKDTVISGQSYKKIARKRFIAHYSYVGYTYVSSHDSISNPPLFTYEQNDTVFIYADGIVEPIYYFNAQVGDTLYTRALPCRDTLIRQVVDSVGTLVINSDTLRFYTTRVIDSISMWGYEWELRPVTTMVVEGVGAADNFFYPSYACEIDQNIPGRFCSYTGGGMDYPNSTKVESCDVLPPLQVGTAELNTQPIAIFPNPNNGIFRIETPAGGWNDLKVTDSMGREVAHTRAGNEIKLHRSAAGVYFVQVLSGQTNYRAKLIVHSP